ncbi:ligand-binding sensor domain-containing protein [Aliikangiella sp. IMCC44359]|uniref:ligand-binding sensor domain-containing protein n=1 Tax=Aliikangiella sp. IMCC44359 TaxID=3459125 RepID=UPI00403B1868
MVFLSRFILGSFLAIYTFLVHSTTTESGVARQYNFQEYTVFDGLPQGQVISIIQDSQGYIWTGSYAGITRYNGREFETFTKPLPSNSVRSMVRSYQGKIIVATAAGLCYLEKSQITCPPLNNKLPLKNIYQVISTDSGDLWLAAEGGVMHVTESTLKTYTLKDGLPSTTVRSMIQDQTGNIWAGTSSGVAHFNGSHFEKIISHELKNISIRALLETGEGIWVGGSTGLFLINSKTYKVSKIDSPEFNNNGILSLYEDSRGILWIGTYHGLYRMINNQIERLSPQRGLKRMATYSIIEDRDGTLWYGSDAGLVKHVPGPFVTYTESQGLSNDFVRSMSVDRYGHIWMGTRKGVSVFNPYTEKFRILTSELKLKDIRIYGLKCLLDGSVLIGTQNGMIHWKNEKAYGPYTIENGLPSSYASTMMQDQKGNVWIGTSRGLALWENDQIKQVTQSEFTIGGIYFMQTDLLGRVWLGTGNRGVVIYDPEKQKYITLDHIPQANKFTTWSIDRDLQGNMWVGTNGNGLLKISQDLKLLNVFDKQNGLGNNYVWQVMVDTSGKVWVYTNNGLKRYNGKSFTHFDGADGLPDLEGAATAVAEHPSGDLWFGTAFGVTRYAPSNEVIDSNPPPIIIDGVWLGDKRLTSSEVLEFKGKSLTVKFSSLSFRDERDIQFSYRLLGANNNWSKPQPHNQVKIINLSPGQYELQVKAIKGARFDSAVPASFSFGIKPPFWLTWWFIFIAILSIILLVAVIIRYRVRKLASEKEHLEILVAERTSELSEINNELNRLVVTDDLTKLYNRRHLMDCLYKDVERLSRAPSLTYLSFIIFDVDNFKMINDTYGHVVGDLVLIELAKRIKKSIRKTDIAARYGGEEFAVILPLTDTRGAETCAEKIRTEVADSKFQINQQEKIQVTVSIGVSTIENNKRLDNIKQSDDIIRQADIALYQAKEHGRNKTCVFDANIEKP